jgi:hypothetical protein
MYYFFQKSNAFIRNGLLLMLVSVCIISSNLRGDCFPFDDSDQLSIPSAGRDLNLSRIKTLTLSAGADSDLFESPKKFPHVQNVAIGNHTNSKYLKDLSLNYTSLMKLGIIQTKPLKSQDVETLKKFDHLKGLSLDCPIESVDQLEKCLPASLVELMINPNSDITNSSNGLHLSKVRTLRLVGVEISAKFLKNLHCPELVTLYLLNSTIEKNSFSDFGFPPKLKKIFVTRTRLSAEDIAAIANNRIRLVGNPYQEFQPQVLEKPPHLFELPSNGGSTYTLKY